MIKTHLKTNCIELTYKSSVFILTSIKRNLDHKNKKHVSLGSKLHSDSSSKYIIIFFNIKFITKC